MKPRQPANPAAPIALTSAAAFCVALLVAGAVLASLLQPQERSYQPHVGLVCPNDDRVDFSKLVGPSARWGPQDPEYQAALERRRRGFAKRVSRDAPAIRMSVFPALMPGEIRIAAAKSSSGVWAVTRDREGGYPATERTSSQVALSKAQGAELERMLTNPCLYAEPEVIGYVYPTASGDTGNCLDGAMTLVDVSFGGRRRTAIQSCRTYGLTGKLADLLYDSLNQGSG